MLLCCCVVVVGDVLLCGMELYWYGSGWLYVVGGYVVYCDYVE